MKKSVFTILLITLLVSALAACSVKSSPEQSSTTFVTDENGETHIYEVLTDSENQTVLSEIETDSKENTVTEKGGSIVTRKSETTTVKAEDNSSSERNDDNEIPFESGDSNSIDTPKPNITVSDKDIKPEAPTEKQPATDKDGWINKWY